MVGDTIDLKEGIINYIMVEAIIKEIDYTETNYMKANYIHSNFNFIANKCLVA